jgi:hypothetical protein
LIDGAVKRSILFAVLSLVLATTAFAEGVPVWIEPAAPTSTTPIRIFTVFDCYASEPTVTVAGSVITAYWPNESCGSPAFPVEYSVRIPSLLAPGEYRLDVMNPGPGELAGSTTFIVRDGMSPFVIHPFTIPTTITGAVVRLSRFTDVCASGQCTIRVGGVTIEEKHFVDGNALSFVAPPHAPGLVDVSVQEGDVIRHSAAGLYYFNPNAPPPPSVFERILFPVLFSGAGVGGSQWVTEAVVSNPRLWSVWSHNSIFPYVCLGYPCGEQLVPESVQRFNGQGYSKGAVLLVPPEEAGHLAFSLRARDVSQEAEGLGTQIPVVREAGMVRKTLTLLNVPLDSRYRVKLRVYTFYDSPARGPGHANVEILPVTGARRFAAVTLAPACERPPCLSSQYYGELDFPQGAAGELADLYVHLDPGYLGWAFATVTNNRTQQVTIVTADGKGGQACGQRCDLFDDRLEDRNQDH